MNLWKIISYFMELSLRVTQEARISVCTICLYLWFVSVYALPHSLCHFANYSTQVLLDQELILLISLKVWWHLWWPPIVRGWDLGLLQNSASLMTRIFKAAKLQEPSLKQWHSKNLAKTAMPNKLFVITKAFFCIFLPFLYLGFSSYTRELYYVCYIMLA